MQRPRWDRSRARRAPCEIWIYCPFRFTTLARIHSLTGLLSRDWINRMVYDWTCIITGVFDDLPVLLVSHVKASIISFSRACVPCRPFSSTPYKLFLTSIRSKKCTCLRHRKKVDWNNAATSTMAVLVLFVSLYMYRWMRSTK